MTSTLSDNHPPGGHPPTDLYGSSRQVQILTMVLTAINIFAAVVMAARILWDTRTACMERRRRLKKDELPDLGEMDGEKKEGDGGGGGGGIKGLGLKMEREISTSESSTSGEGESDIRAWWEMIPTIDLFPLILAVTIFLQGTMLAVVEGEGWVREPFEGNCRFTSEIAWVALWITPYIVLSFTIEAAIRALSQPRFQPRSGKAVLYCILFALILTLLTWIPSRTMPENTQQDICNGQLMSLVDQFAAGGLGLMAALLPIAIFMGVVVVVHLSRDVAINRVEKMDASRTICFLVINILQWILMVPNYALTARDHPTYPTSELAAVVANIGGIAACGLHFYLRTKTGPADESDRPTEGGETPTEQHQNRNRDTADDQAVLSSIINQYSDTPDISMSPTVNDYSSLEVPSIPRTPLSPTSSYYKGHRSSRAPSFLSQYTTHSFRRLGEEINNMISGLRAADSSAASKHPPAPPTARKPASNYTLFPPTTTINHPVAQVTPTPKPQTPIPTYTLSRPPTRPSRATTPTVDMGRRQPNPKLLEHSHSVKSNKTPQTLQVPKAIAKAKSKATPAKPFEVAVPPRADTGDAESFMEILMWKKDNPRANRV